MATRRHGPWTALCGVALAAGCLPADWAYDLTDAAPRDVRPRDAGAVRAPSDDRGARDTSPAAPVDVTIADDARGVTDALSPDRPASRDLPTRDAPTCVDTDGDGISDEIEGAPYARSALRPGAPADFESLDSDDDGISDAAEARRAYAGFAASARPELRCGDAPDDCDGDGRWNHQDRDSDDDGIGDREEATTWRSDPCAADTDGDGVTDLVEVAAGSSPTDRADHPPDGSIYVTLPYLDRAGPRTREFSFRTRIRSADVMFLVDTTGSMGTTIAQVRDTLSTQIVPGIAAAFGAGADVRYGMAEHRDFAEGGADYALRVLQPLDADPSRAQGATYRLAAAGGGDGPEAMVPAMHALLSGVGTPAYGGTATRAVAPADCGDDPTAFGWGCFRPGSVPIVVLFSDADWHNGPFQVAPNFYGSVAQAARYDELVAEMTRREAYFVGIDVASGATYQASLDLARRTGSVDAAGAPVAYRGAPETVTASVVSAVTTLAQGTRQDVEGRAHGDPTEARLPRGRTAADFVARITPSRGDPPAPLGFASFDAAAFRGVAPTTVVTFEVALVNDFYRNVSGAAQLFRATIAVLGRAGSALDTIPVFVVVPTDPNVLD